MIDICSITENWAKKYKPMLHDEQSNKRFFYCNGDKGFRDVLQHILPEQSPSVMVDSEVIGGISPRSYMREYTIYFAVRCEEMASDSSLHDANEEAVLHALCYYCALNRMPELKKFVDFDVKIQSYDIGFDGWTSVMMMIQSSQPTNLCIDDGRYEE